MKILLIATKAPWPTQDGGRLLLWSTLEGLAARGHQVTLVAPQPSGRSSSEDAAAALAGLCVPHLVPTLTRHHVTSLVRSLVRRRPLSIERHGHHDVRHEVQKLLARERWDVVHAEQLQALAQARPARFYGVPVVLRAQNVESELWQAAAEHRPWTVLGQWEARRLALWEGRAVARVAATVALTERDAARLRELSSGKGRVHVVRAPFADALPPFEGRLAGDPPLVLFGSEGWSPNRDAVRHFGESIWPAVRAALPAARLHVFGNWHRSLAAGQVEWLPGCEHSRQAFVPGSILVLPLRFASGVRMRILEAWARGVPVVATREAASGLGAEDGRELLLAEDGPGFAAAVGRLARESDLAAQLTAAGRALLRAHHAPAAAAERLEAIYREVASSSGRKLAMASAAL